MCFSEVETTFFSLHAGNGRESLRHSSGTFPGYLTMPRKGDETLQQYLDNYTKKTGLWADYPKYLVSTLKAYYGKHATADNDFGYCWLPKLTGNHSFFEFLYDMLDGKME